MEEQGPAGGAERQVARLVEDDEIGVGEPSRNLAGLPLVLFLPRALTSSTVEKNLTRLR
jgi:hypothetical protein